MYDFYFGSRADIVADEPGYLLFIKRMLPRWCNSIPDSEYLALHNAVGLLGHQDRPPVLLETGVGASTIALLHHAMKHDGVLYSWDYNGLKGAFLRGVFTDTLVAHHRKPLADHWKFIAYDSLSEHLGISILAEFGAAVDLCFFDSEHTRERLLGELSRTDAFLRDGSIVVLDDANYTYVHTNVAYISMLRRKLGLTPVPQTPDNTCDPFYLEVERFLKSRWTTVEYLPDSYKREYRQDLFWAYFRADRDAMSREGMEKSDALEHRFDSWRVSGRKG